MFQLGCSQLYILTVQLLQLCVCARQHVLLYVCVCEMFFYCTIYLCLACSSTFTVRLLLITCRCCSVPRGRPGDIAALCGGQRTVRLLPRHRVLHSGKIMAKRVPLRIVF